MDIVGVIITSIIIIIRDGYHHRHRHVQAQAAARAALVAAYRRENFLTRMILGKGAEKRNPEKLWSFAKPQV